MKKKFSLWAAFITLLITVFAFQVGALSEDRPFKETETIRIVDHVVYELKDGEYTVKGFDGSEEAKNITEIRILNEIDSVPVIRISERAFKDNSKITHVILPANVVFISDYAFNNCKNLDEINTDNIEFIGSYAFEDCTGIKAVRFTSALEIISQGAFKNSGLTSVTIPGSADAKEAAFRNCKDLEKVIFSNEGCTGEKLIFSPLKFVGCTNLKNIYFYRQVEDIGIYSDCFSMESASDAFNLSNIYFFGSEKLWNTLVTSKEAKRFGDVDMHYYYKHTHSFEKTSKKATCTKIGKDTYACVCGDSFSYKTEKDKNNHSFGEWKTTKKATKTKNGTQEHACKLCGKKETRKLIHIAKLNISSKDVVYIGSQKYNQKIVVKNGKTKLKKGTHYTLAYKNNTVIGTATATVKGVEKNGYYGSAKITFDILPDSVSDPTAKKILEDMKVLTWNPVEGAMCYKIFAIVLSDEAPGGYYSDQIAVSETTTAEVPARYETFKIQAYETPNDYTPIEADIPYETTEIKKRETVLYCSWSSVDKATGYKIYNYTDEGYKEIADVKDNYAELSPDFKKSALYVKAYTKNNDKSYYSPYYKRL